MVGTVPMLRRPLQNPSMKLISHSTFLKGLRKKSRNRLSLFLQRKNRPITLRWCLQIQAKRKSNNGTENPSPDRLAALFLYVEFDGPGCIDDLQRHISNGAR